MQVCKGRDGRQRRGRGERDANPQYSSCSWGEPHRTNAAAAAAAITLVYSFSCMDPVMDASAGLDSGGDGDYLGCV